MNDIIVDEFGACKEFDLLSVGESSNEIPDIPEVETDTTAFTIDEAISQATAINDIAENFSDRTLVEKLKYPQAVALHAATKVIMLDKEVWFSGMIAIKAGNPIDQLLYDEPVHWADDPKEDPATTSIFT